MSWPWAGEGQGAVVDWARILAYVTGTVDQELLARNGYLAAENRIMKAQLKGRLKLSDAERGALGEIGHHRGRLQESNCRGQFVLGLADAITSENGASTGSLPTSLRRRDS